MKNLIKLSVLVLLGLELVSAKNVFTRRFLRMGRNMCTKDIAATVEIMKRMSAVGYNGVFWDDAKIPVITKSSMMKCANENLTRVKAEADKLNLHFMCYSHGQTEPTRNDEHLAEALPVTDSPFKVTGTEAVLESDQSVSIADGGFENFSGVTHTTWRVTKATPNVNFFVDKSEFKSGAASVRFENPGKSARISQDVALKAGRAYELTVWIKTENYSNRRDPGTFVLVGQRWLLNVRGGVFGNKIAATQGWKRYTVDFNSVVHSKVIVLLYASYQQSQVTGKIWFDDISIREVGLYDRHERDNLPVIVKNESGTAYQPGKDYVVGKGKLTIPVGSAITDGQKLKVSWYQKAEFLHAHPEASFCQDETWKIVTDNGVALNKIFGNPRGWFTKYSEWRLGGWDPLCKSSPYNYKNSAEYMGGTQKRTFDILRNVTGNCNLESYVWNDAYDPYHNATSQYWLINGPVNPSWAHLDPKTVILNWREGKKYESIRFFAGMDPAYSGVYYRQLLSFWSQSPPDASGSWFDVLDRLEKEGLKDGAIIGMQYTTWSSNNYDRIEAYAKASQNVGRWGDGPVPWESVDPSCKLGIGADASAAQGNALTLSAIATPSRSVVVRYRLPQQARVRLAAIDMRGRVVAVLQNKNQRHGDNTLVWDARKIAAGVYFLRLSVDGDPVKPGWDGHLVRRVVVH